MQSHNCNRAPSRYTRLLSSMMMKVQLTKYTSRCSTSLSTKPLVVRVWDSRLWEVPIVPGEPWASSSGDLLDRWHRHHQRVYCQHQPPPSLQNGLSWRSSSLGAASWDQRRLQKGGASRMTRSRMTRRRVTRRRVTWRRRRTTPTTRRTRPRTDPSFFSVCPLLSVQLFS